MISLFMNSGRTKMTLTTSVALVAVLLACASAGLVLLMDSWRRSQQDSISMQRMREVAEQSWEFTFDSWEDRARSLAQIAVLREGVMEAVRRGEKNSVMEILGTLFNYSSRQVMLSEWSLMDAEGRAYAFLGNPKREAQSEPAVLDGRLVTTFRRIERVAFEGLPSLVVPIYDEHADIIGWFHLIPGAEALIEGYQRIVGQPVMVDISGRSAIVSDDWRDSLEGVLLGDGNHCETLIDGRVIRCATFSPWEGAKVSVGFDVTRESALLHASSVRQGIGVAMVLFGFVILGVMMIDRRVRPVHELAVSLAGARESWELDYCAPASCARDVAALAETMMEWSGRMRDQMFELSVAHVEAERASQSKSEFLANMSHEIRTPMTAILGYAELLMEPGISQEVIATHVQTIRRNGGHLLEIINDILDVSKIEAGKMTVEYVGCSPVRIIEDVYELMRDRAESKGIALTTAYTFPIPTTVMTDPVRFRQIVLNLVGNAVKFTTEGEVRIGVSFESRNKKLLVYVEDTGVGMTEKQVGHVFGAFEQADNSTTRKFGGTGLGLAISKRLAEMLDGKIEIESELGVGSRFMYEFDPGPIFEGSMLDTFEEFKAAEGEKSSVDLSASGMKNLDARILLAEDGDDNQRLISFMLQKAGASVETAENGQVAVDMVAEAEKKGERYDIILMDMQMPEMDGYTAAGVLRMRGCSTPIIALTANAMQGDREKCLCAGCDDYATKPVDRRALIEVCLHWLGQESDRAAKAA